MSNAMSGAGVPAKSSLPPQRLTVSTSDQAAELYIIDSSLNLVARGSGLLTAELPPGIYKVKARVGLNSQERLVALGSAPQSVTLDRFEFASAAPLDATLRTHEFHMAAAYKESRAVHVPLGKGGRLFIFARDWTSKDRPANTPAPASDPAAGLRVTDSAGRELVDVSAKGACSGEWEPWRACNIELDPGHYRLRLAASSGEVFEQAVIVSPGWQTQVFLLQRTYCRDWRGPDLVNASILMGREGFTPSDSSERRAELARIGLAAGRNLLGPADIDGLLNAKFENPMYGIFGLHLLLLQDPERKPPPYVIDRLRSLVGGNHPDVEGIALLSGQTGYSFECPPMLRRTWDILTSADLKHPEIIPDGSLSSRIAGRTSGEGTWLTWRALNGEESNGLGVYVRNQLRWLRTPNQRPGAAPKGASFMAQAAPADAAPEAPTPEEVQRLAEAFRVPPATVRGILNRSLNPAPVQQDLNINRSSNK